MTQSNKKTVVIVEDDAGLQEQLISVLRNAPDLNCLYAVSSGEEALQKIPVRTPDVVLMDIKLPGMSGIDCVAALKKQLPSLEIIMLTIYKDAESIFQALKAGASGYLIKSSEPEKLYNAIRDVSSGGAPFSNHIARKVVQYFQDQIDGPEPSANDDKKLSPREQELMELMAAGYRYREIAVKMGIGLETVRSYVKNICVKMHVRNRIEALMKHYG
ncbi:MAG: response regulator transcription factor [Verrucomicrobiales bacterium]|jgi:DNA-binding NarL/FixJ family response regulator|nr:response regulator transcription factor [Verrucomicrobiales bacterium]